MSRGCVTWVWLAPLGAILALGPVGQATAQCTQASPCVSGPVNLGVLSGDVESFAYGVSADGSVVVGASLPVGGLNNHAIRWTASSGMQSIGSFGGDFLG